MPRVVVDDPYLSNNQLAIEEDEEGRARLENLSQRVSIVLADGTALGPCSLLVVDLPTRLSVGMTLIEIEAVSADGDLDRATLRTIEQPVRLPAGQTVIPFSHLSEAPSAEQVARWFETLIAVQRSAASSPGFYAETARAVVELIGLDCGLVLLSSDDDWKVVARHRVGPESEMEFSRTIVKYACEEGRTFYQVLPAASPTRSQVGGSAVVAAPILGGEGRRPMGVVYGSRDPRPDGSDVSIRPLEAQLVQVLAAAVAAGLSRLESEDLAARRQRQFMDFFSPELARELDRNPHLLDGERREVTVLFSDIRGFSRASERLSPEDTCALVRDVMERLSRRIREHKGVVVDYIGDAVLALWNAPADQQDHATLACRAALAMQEEVPGLNETWSGRIGGPLGLGIGLNTGPALVGNTGSQTRFKYGPLGHAVNLAGRIEGATKQVGVSILITGSTHDALGDHDFATRRLCRVAVVGIDGPVVLYELYAPIIDPAWRARRDQYEAGLRLFEDGALSEACATLQGLLEGRRGHYDMPTLTLVGRAIEHLRDPSRPFDPIIRLSYK